MAILLFKHHSKGIFRNQKHLSKTRNLWRALHWHRSVYLLSLEQEWQCNVELRCRLPVAAATRISTRPSFISIRNVRLVVSVSWCIRLMFRDEESGLSIGKKIQDVHVCHTLSILHRGSDSLNTLILSLGQSSSNTRLLPLLMLDTHLCGCGYQFTSICALAINKG